MKAFINIEASCPKRVISLARKFAASTTGRRFHWILLETIVLCILWAKVTAPAAVAARQVPPIQTKAGKPANANIVGKTTTSHDRTAPSIRFLPLHDQQGVADFSQIGGEVNEEAVIVFTISRLEESLENVRYWTGREWTANSNEPGTNLRGASVDSFWFRAAETFLPKTSEIDPGSYVINVSAFDRAGNEGRAAITVRKIEPVSIAESVNPAR